jgi:PLP dependent protein
LHHQRGGFADAEAAAHDGGHLSIADKLQRIRKAIDDAAIASARAPQDVLLVAVSKTHPVEALAEAYDAGQRHFGENYVQELAQKRALFTHTDVVWHFIGRVQSGNAGSIVAHADVVHGIGSMSQLASLSKEATKQQRRVRGMLQINIDDEAQKNGFAPAELLAQLPALMQQPSGTAGLQLEGLMCLPMAGQGASAFARVRAWRDAHAPAWTTLSMGMSDDFHDAIAQGSTCVRVGSAIFGSRT